MKENMPIIAVLDCEEHGREWPEEIGGLPVFRIFSDFSELEGKNIFLYAIHITDFEPIGKKGKFSGNNKDIWPQNTLWYTGGGRKKEEQNGHMYKCPVDHNIKTTDPFFKAIESLVKKIKCKPEIQKEDWDALYSKRDRLIALSILCQGYLAARGGKGLKGWKETFKGLLVKDAEEKTEDRDWWKPAFGDNLEGDELKSELENAGVEKKVQDELFKLIESREIENAYRHIRLMLSANT